MKSYGVQLLNMTLKELLLKVNEKQLSKEQIEGYRDELSNLYALLMLELADLRKAKAIYFIEQKQKTDVATERQWAVTKEGQREIEIAHYAKAVEKILSSLKSRLYQVY